MPPRPTSWRRSCRPISTTPSRDADTKANGLGWMTKEKWANTIKVLTDQGALKGTVAADAAFTDAYLKP